MVGGPARDWRGGHTDAELITFSPADDVPFRAWRSEDIKHQGGSIPSTKAIKFCFFPPHLFLLLVSSLAFWG